MSMYMWSRLQTLFGGGSGKERSVWEQDYVYVANVQFKYSGKEFCLRFLPTIIFIGLEEVLN